MGIWDWLSDVMDYLQQLWQRKKGRLVLLGLDNAGKTTLLQMLTEGRLGQHMPTMHAHQQEAVVGGVTFTAIDIGGHFQARQVWGNYYMAADAVVFMVDAADQSRFAESKAELDILLADEQMQSTPVLVLGNKIDISHAVSEQELEAAFGLQGHTTGRPLLSWRDKRPQRPLELFMCSIKKEQGYGEGFRWLVQFI